MRYSRYSMEGGSEEALIGGLKNALSRGESLDQARFSFLNAGYAPQVVDMAVSALNGYSGAPTVVEQQVPVQVPQSSLPLRATESMNQSYESEESMQESYVPQQQVIVKKQSFPVPYWVVILMLLLSLAIVVGAGVLGLYWHQLFPG